jgi:hypothetical protein
VLLVFFQQTAAGSLNGFKWQQQHSTMHTSANSLLQLLLHTEQLMCM